MLPDLSGLPISVPMIFLIFELVAVGGYVILHFFLGLKRGLAKTLYFFIGHVILVLLIFWLIGLFSVTWFINETNLRNWFGNMSIGEQTINDIIDMVAAANGLPLIFAIVDLVAKVVLFIVLYGLLRWLFMLIIFGIPWKIITANKDKDEEPRFKLAGGLVGLARGAFAGFIMLFPLLILIDTVVGEGVNMNGTEFEEVAQMVNETNDYNFVKYVNVVKFGEVGAADFLFDLAFRSAISNSEEVIIWRSELSWMTEFGRIALPFFFEDNNAQLGLMDDPMSLDYETFITFRSAFDKLAESTLINASLTPALYYGFDMLSKEYSEVPQSTLDYIQANIASLDIKLTEDIDTIFDAVAELLSIQPLNEWMVTFEDPKSILSFSEDDQEHLKNAIQNFTQLSLFKVSDLALEFMLYTDEVKDNLTWVEEENRITYLNGMRDKIRNFNSTDSSTLMGATLVELGNLISSIAFDFPGVTVQGVDYNFAEFLDGIGDMMVILNDDPEYHAWFKQTLQDIASLSIFDLFLEELVGFGANAINLGEAWTEEEHEQLRDIIRTNFADSDELRNQLEWVADVYKAIGDFGVGPMFKEDANMLEEFDNIMQSVDGPTKFNALIDTLLEGQLISDLTSQMSQVLVNKYVTDAFLREPFDKVLAIPGFSFSSEIAKLANVIGKLYEVDGFSLKDALDSENAIDVLFPAIVEFVEDEDNRNLLLGSDILYALIDIQLQQLEEFDLPTILFETSGNYEGWIKRNEIKTVLEIFAKVGITEIPSGEEAMNDMIEKLLDFTATEENRDLVLSSDFIYFMMSDQLLKLEVENFEIPETAIVPDGDYKDWISRDELKKLLHALSILEIKELPGEGGLPLDGINSVKLSQVINLESAILTRLITTQIKNANLIDIPLPAFTDGDQKDLTVEELQSIAQLLEDLDIEITELQNSDSEDLLSKIYVSALLNVDYANSWIIRAFVTYGIKTALTVEDVHPLAVDELYAEVLSADEVEALFNALDALSGGNNDTTLQDLTTSLTPDSMTVDDLTLVINAGSILINEQITKEVEKQFTIHPKAIDPRTVAPEVPTLILQSELVKLTDAILVIDDGANNSIPDLMEALQPDELTFKQMNDIIDIDSLIIRSVISENILGVELIEALTIKEVAYEDADRNSNMLTATEIKRLIDALNVLATSEDDFVMPVVTNLEPQDITLDDVKEMVSKESLILLTLISNELKDTDGFEIYPDTIDEDGDIYQADLDDLFNALSVGLGGDKKISDLADLVSSITMKQIMDFNAADSLIKDGMISKMIVDSLPNGRASVRVDAYEASDLAKPEPFGLLTSDEITKLFTSLYILSGSDDEALLMDLTTQLTDTNNLTLGDIVLAINNQSIIINSLVSEQVIDVLTPQDVHPDATDTYDTPFGYPSVLEITPVEMAKFFNALGTLGSDTTLSDLASTLSDTLSVTEIKVMLAEESILLKGKISRAIVSAVKEYRVVAEAYVPGDTFGLLTDTEISNLLDALETISGTDPILDIAEELAETASNLTVTVLEDIHSKDSLIIRYFISEGINGFADPDINVLAFEAGYVGEFYTYTEINEIIAGIKALTPNPDAQLTAVIGNMTSSLDITVLETLFAEDEDYSYVIQREISNVISLLELDSTTIPESAYVGGSSANKDITPEEFRALSKAVVALGFTDLELGAIEPGDIFVEDVYNALLEDSKIMNRLISKAFITSGLATAESRTSVEDVLQDVQYDEMLNTTDAFVKLGINDLNNAFDADWGILVANAKSLDREAFRVYIDFYQDEEDEDIGLTIVKDFLYDILSPFWVNPFIWPHHDAELDRRVELDMFIYDDLP